MPDEKEKSCYTCQHFLLCFIRHRIWGAIIGTNILHETIHIAIFREVGNLCSEYSSGKDGE